ncbi:MAG: NfeD family protein [Gaiellales bacterium]
MDTWLITWIVVAAAFTILELATMAFVAIYIAVGAAAAAMVAWAGGNVGLQLAAFSATAVVLMLLTRPVFKRKLEAPNIATNVDRMVGRGGVVTITIDNDANTGQVRIGTEYWTARLPEDAAVNTIPVDARVSVIAIEGVTARVLPREAFTSTSEPPVPLT